MVVRYLSIFFLLSGLVQMNPVQATGQVFFQSNLEPSDPYVQQQVRYTVRFYYGSEVLQGYFVPPEIERAVMEMVGEDEPVELEVDGHAMRMIERRYLIFPQRSGELMIPGMVFSGRQVFVRAADNSLQVRPSFTPQANWHWLPAGLLTIDEEWSDETGGWHTGDIVERRITVEAYGLTAAQIPAVPLPDMPGVELRRTRTELDNRIEGFGMVGRRIEHHTLVFKRAGDYVLPAVKYVWWDTIQNNNRVTMLPERLLGVTGSATSDETVTVYGTEPVMPETDSGDSMQSDNTPQRMFALVLFSFVMTIMLWRLVHHLKSPVGRFLLLCAARYEIRQACNSNDYLLATKALRYWARHYFDMQRVPTLGELVRKIDDENVNRAILELETFLYGKIQNDWDGKRCWQQIASSISCGQKTRPGLATRVLPPLNG